MDGMKLTQLILISILRQLSNPLTIQGRLATAMEPSDETVVVHTNHKTNQLLQELELELDELQLDPDLL